MVVLLIELEHEIYESVKNSTRAVVGVQGVRPQLGYLAFH